MIGWDRCGDRTIGVFSPRQVRWLRKHLTSYCNRIDMALSGNLDDPVIAAVFSAGEGNRVLRLAQSRASVTTVLDDLPTWGGVVEIPETNRMMWIWSVQELRMALDAQLCACSPVAATTQPSDATSKLQLWLSGVIGTLAETSELPPMTHGPHNDHRSTS